MPKGMFKVISFDFGGTLAYEAEEEHVVLWKTLKQLGLRYGEEEVKLAYEKEKLEHENRQASEVWTEETQVRFLTGILNRLGVEEPRITAEKICRLYADILDVRKFEDVDETLTLLKRNGHRLIVISNIASESRLKRYLQRLGLLPFFEYTIASGSVGYEKPDSRIFLHACQLIGVKPSEMMHIGDSYEHDYKGAEAVGAFPILIDRKNNYKNLNCRKVDNLRKIMDFLQKAL